MRTKLPYIIMGILLLAAVVLLLKSQHRQLDLRFTLNARQKTPYGSYAPYHLLSSFFPGASIETNQRQPQKWKSLSLDTSGQVLLIVNNYFNPSEADLDYLTAFAQRGNYILISAMSMNDAAQRFFRIQQPLVFEQVVIPSSGEQVLQHPGDSLQLLLDTAQFSTPLLYNYPGRSYSSYYTGYDTAFTYPLGYNGAALPNLLGMHTSRGRILLHSAPVAFTNLFTLYGNNYTYIEKLLKLVPAKVHRVVWDEYFQHKPADADNQGSKGLLTVLLQYTSFRWAFYCTLLLLLMYVFTAIKRKQRVIPVYNRPVNESLAFVTTVGKLYYEKADHTNLAEKLTQFFLDHVRTRYKMNTTELNSSFVQLLALKSGVELSEVEAIIQHIHQIQLQGNISAQQLMAYYEQLEQFYKKA